MLAPGNGGENGKKMGMESVCMCVCMCDRVGVYRRVICVLNLLFTHGVQNRCHLNTITCPSPHRLSNTLTMHVRNFGGQTVLCLTANDNQISGLHSHADLLSCTGLRD